MVEGVALNRNDLRVIPIVRAAITLLRAAIDNPDQGINLLKTPPKLQKSAANKI